MSYEMLFLDFLFQPFQSVEMTQLMVSLFDLWVKPVPGSP